MLVVANDTSVRKSKKLIFFATKEDPLLRSWDTALRLINAVILKF